MRRAWFPPRLARRSFRRVRLAAGASVAVLSLTLPGCAAPEAAPVAPSVSWATVQQQARGQTVSLRMYGGDEQGNRYVDTVLAPAAAAEGVTLRRVPVAATTDALNKVLAKRRAGVKDGAVDLV